MNVYLDYAATAPMRAEVLEEMLPLMHATGNPDSLHAYGRSAAYAVSKARDLIAAVLGVLPSEVYFTSGGTESGNWAVRKLGEGKALVSQIEHAAVRSAASLRREGAEFFPVDEGGIACVDALKERLTPDTGLVAMMSVNNETGALQPIKEVSALARARGAIFFSDCVQAPVCLDMGEISPLFDAFSLSAHKLGGPAGVGALVVKKGIRIRPLIAGGEQEKGLRGGTLNAAGIVGFARALELSQKEREAFCKHTGRLRDLFENILRAKIQDKIRIDGGNRAPNISHITLTRGGEVFLNRLDLEGVAASGGAACSAHSGLPSHVMLAMGRSEEEAKRGVRFSFGRETTEEEVVYAAETVIKLILGNT